MSTTVTVKNPAAGRGEAVRKCIDAESEYITKSVGDAEKYSFELCSENPDVHITVCGGDGTVNEVVNGIMRAGTGKTSSLSVVPAGTGNDFVRCFNPGDSLECDVGKYGDRYFINMLNVGFDCNVVVETGKLKKLPLISGSMAYILGVVKCLFSKFGQKITVELTDCDGNVERYSEDMLLLAVANASYYGGGFCASPMSELQDGLLDVILVKKTTRLRFLTVVGKYKKGEHFDKETGKIRDKYTDILVYRKCRSITVDDTSKICVDGEIEERSHTDITVVPKALKLEF